MLKETAFVFMSHPDHAPLQGEWALPTKVPGAASSNITLVNSPSIVWRKGGLSTKHHPSYTAALFFLVPLNNLKASYVSEAQEEATLLASPDMRKQITHTVKEETAIDHQLVKSIIVSSII